MRYRSRASCRRGESARPSGAPLARLGLPPAPQSSASSRAAAARRAIAVERHGAGCNVRSSLVLGGTWLETAMSLECGNAACRKALTLPFLQCAKFKAAAYCSKACQVPPPPPKHAARCARARACAH